MDILYGLAFSGMAGMGAALGASIWFENLNNKRRKNSIRYRKWMNYRPDVLDVRWEEVVMRIEGQ